MRGPKKECIRKHPNINVDVFIKPDHPQNLVTLSLEFKFLAIFQTFMGIWK